MSPSKKTKDPRRGEIWLLRFDPAEGAEIRKTRLAVVLNVPAVGKLPLRLVAPITEWKARYSNIPWLVFVRANARNGLSKDSAADAFQVKSVSIERFVSRIGETTGEEIEEVSAAVALCVGA